MTTSTAPTRGTSAQAGIRRTVAGEVPSAALGEVGDGLAQSRWLTLQPVEPRRLACPACGVTVLLAEIHNGRAKRLGRYTLTLYELDAAGWPSAQYAGARGIRLHLHAFVCPGVGRRTRTRHGVAETVAYRLEAAS